MRIPVVRVAFTTPLALALAALPLAAQRAVPDSARRHVDSLPAVIVTGTLSRLPAPGVARTAISRAELRAEPVRLAVDALRRAPGVHIDEENGPLGPTLIRLRGGDEPYTQVLVDGVQVNENGGFFDASGVTLVGIDRLEIARGPQSAVYGTSAMSGVVQMLSRAGTPGAMRTEAMAEGARTSPRGGGGRASLESSGGSEGLRYAFGLGRAVDRGIYALPNDMHSDDASLRLDLVPAGPVTFTATARYMGTNSLLPVQDPGIDRAPLDPNQRQGRNRLLGSLDAVWAPSNRWTNRFTVADYRLVFTYDNQKDNVDTTRYTIPFFNANYHYHSVLQRTTARYVSTMTGTAGRSLGYAFSFGGDWEREALGTDASGDFGPSTLDLSRPNLAAFVEGQFHAGDALALLLGARSETFRGVGRAVVPRATIAYTILPDRLTLRGAVAGAYKAPQHQDEFPAPGGLAGPPAHGAPASHSAELGIDLGAERAHASFTVFRQQFDDLIRIVPFDTTNTKFINRNLGRTNASGLEAEASFVPRARWLLAAEGAWTATKVVDNRGQSPALYPTGQPLPFRPAYTASAFATFPLSALSATVRLSGVGRQTVFSERFSGSRASIDPYRVLGVTATYPVTAAFDAYVHAENALNAGYAMAYDKPGAPRSVALGVRVRQ